MPVITRANICYKIWIFYFEHPQKNKVVGDFGLGPCLKMLEYFQALEIFV